jgi:hypothetical protein
METSSGLKLASRMIMAALAMFLWQPAAAATQEPDASMVTVCHRTGVQEPAWVFLTLEASAWPEHEAHGDFRAGSLAECAQAQGDMPPATADAGVLPPSGALDRTMATLTLLGLGAAGGLLRHRARRMTSARTTR